MKEIAKTLKSFGPKYTLEWSMDYFGSSPCMIMTLRYLDTSLNLKVQHQSKIPFDQIEYLNDHGPQFLEDMHRAVREKIMEAWKKV